MADKAPGVAWSEEIAQRIGDTVRKRRTELGMSAQAVADRTEELGFPIGRGTIARMETGARGGKFDISELIVLAAALETTPMNLMWADAPDGEIQIIPEHHVSSGEGFAWFDGHWTSPPTWEHAANEVAVSALQMITLRRVLDYRRALREAQRRRRNEETEDTRNAVADALSMLADVEERAVQRGLRIKGHDNG